MDIGEFVHSLENLPELTTTLYRIEEKLDRLLAAIPTREVICVDDICKKLQISRDSLRSRPWLLPNFGVSDFPGRKKRWDRDTWKKWSEDFPAREAAWQSLSTDKRKRIISGSTSIAHHGGSEYRVQRQISTFCADGKTIPISEDARSC